MLDFFYLEDSLWNIKPWRRGYLESSWRRMERQEETLVGVGEDNSVMVVRIGRQRVIQAVEEGEENNINPIEAFLQEMKNI